MQITPHCYAVCGLNAAPPWVVNAGFVVGSNETLVVDSGWNRFAAQTILGYARCAQPNNKLMLVNTESHSDHVGGNCLFREEGIPIFGIPGGERHDDEWAAILADYNESIVDTARRERLEGDYQFKSTRFANPDRSVVEEMVVDLEGVQARFIPTPGHTPQNLSIFVEGDRVLYCGDCIVENYMPNLENDSPQTRSDWMQSLERVRSLDPKFVVPGHGQVLRGDSITKEIQRHMTVLRG